MGANEVERQRWNDPEWTHAWPKREQLTDAVTPVLLGALSLQPGERVLDVGCGGGKTTIAAGARVGEGGTAVGADISRPLVELARLRAVEAGAANVSFQVADAQVDPVDGAPFDLATSQFGVMFFDDPVAAFANIRAHLRPGGRLGFACWQPATRNPWLIRQQLAAFLPGPPPGAPGEGAPGPFALADADRVRGILDGAGFTGVSVAPHELLVEVPEEAVVDEAQLATLGIPADRLPEARRAVDEHMGQFRLPSGQCRLPLAFQVVTATA